MRTCFFSPPEIGMVNRSMLPSWFDTCATLRLSGETAGANSSRVVLVIGTGLPPLAGAVQLVIALAVDDIRR